MLSSVVHILAQDGGDDGGGVIGTVVMILAVVLFYIVGQLRDRMEARRAEREAELARQRREEQQRQEKSSAAREGHPQRERPQQQPAAPVVVVEHADDIPEVEVLDAEPVDEPPAPVRPQRTPPQSAPVPPRPAPLPQAKPAAWQMEAEQRIQASQQPAGRPETAPRVPASVAPIDIHAPTPAAYESVFADLEAAEGATADALWMIVGSGNRGAASSSWGGGSFMSTSVGRRGRSMEWDPPAVRKAIIFAELLQPPLAMRQPREP